LTNKLFFVPAHSVIASAGPRAFPIREVFQRLGVSQVTGYQLIKRGELETYMLGRRRFATADALAAFFERRIATSNDEPEDRAKRTAKATAASLVCEKRAEKRAKKVSP